MNRVIVYIDGFNLYHAIEKLDNPTLKWLNIWKLCEQHLREGEILEKVNFFTAIWPYDQSKQQRHKNFLAALRAVGVTVIEGNFKKSNRVCYTQERTCAFREEKQTDVAIGIEMIKDALEGNGNRLILVTADSDQIPTAKMINGLGVALSLVFPPGRAREARDLGELIPDRKELTIGQLLTCPLPRSVTNEHGKPVAFMPALYQK